MKLICETCTINRTVSGGKRVFLKTILAIGKGSERKADETKIMLITTSNKTGTKYPVLNNIGKIFTRFLEEGKATISFLAPEHDVQIKSDKIQLTAFLKVLKLVLTGGRRGNDGDGQMLSTTETSSPAQPVPLRLPCLTVDSKKASMLGSTNVQMLSTTETSSPAQPVPLRLPCLTVDSKKASMLGSTNVLSTRCVIKHRKDYPSKGFSRLLVSLQISDIKLCRLDTQIMLLPQLRSLNLSNNSLQQLPRKFGQMRLIDLDLSGNNLQDSAEGWQWLLEPNIQSTLQTLNISGNGLSFLPINLIYARSLVTLMADNNLIQKIPFALWKMQRLRELSLANNHITAIPETLRRMRLQRLDLSANELSEKEATVPDLRLPETATKVGQPSSLFESAARVVIQRKIPYWLPGIVPFTIVETLHRTPLCGCGQPCFESKVYERAKVIMLNCKHIILNANHQLYADCVFCSLKCSRKV